MTINETVEQIQVTESAETITVVENVSLVGGGGGGGGDGNDGWSPILSVVSDGARRVLRVVDWTGGEGTKPATGSYIGATGLVVAIGDAVDIRGATGAAGSNGLNGADGASAFVYIAWATSDEGANFTTTFNPNYDYIAIKATTTPIASPQVSDFTGLWKYYKGQTGEAGTQWYAFDNAPISDAIGNDEDYAIDLSTGDLYYKDPFTSSWIQLAFSMKGDAGASAYVYVAYADDASGTGFTNTFNATKDYIAIKATTSLIASPQASDFAGLWKNYKGETGAAGANGADGADAINPNFSVATGAAGSNVVLSGTYPNLTLTIPRGDQGLGGLNGIDGNDGREVALQVTATHIQWSYVGSPWQNLIALSELQGEPGADAVLPNPIVYYEKQGAIANGTIDIFPVWPESGAIVGIYGAGLKSGTASANFILNATTITGLGSVSLSTTPGGTVNATDNNSFSVGASTPLKVTISSASSADTLFFWLIFNPD